MLLRKLFFLCLVACASAPTPSPVAPLQSGTPTPAPFVAARACDEASTFVTGESDRPKTGWKKVGRVVVRSSGDKFVGMTIEDASGNTIESQMLDLAKKPREVVEREIVHGICRAGGTMGVGKMAGWKEEGATLSFEALVPLVEDEQADLDKLCKMPNDQARVRPPTALQELAGAHFDQHWLTTRQWRGWHRATEEDAVMDVEKEPDKSVLGARASAKADELERLVKPKGYASCWYADLLRAWAAEARKAK
jgi:hypothetical protein